MLTLDMDYPWGRGNIIQWKINNNKIVYIYDHSYNSDFNSLLLMINQSEYFDNSWVIFTPLKECSQLEDKYILLKSQLKNYLIYNPNDHIFNTIFTNHICQDQDQLTKEIMDIIGQTSNDIHLFIKGANSYKMKNIILNLLEYLGDL